MFKEIQKKEKKRQELVAELQSLDQMVWGSFCKIHVKCGKKTCRCQNGKLHPHHRMSWRENGKGISRAVPKEDREWVEEMTGNYRKFRGIRKEIVKLEDEIKSLLDEYEVKVVKKTRKGKPYLDI